MPTCQHIFITDLENTTPMYDPISKNPSSTWDSSSIDITKLLKHSVLFLKWMELILNSRYFGISVMKKMYLGQNILISTEYLGSQLPCAEFHDQTGLMLGKIFYLRIILLSVYHIIWVTDHDTEYHKAETIQCPLSQIKSPHFVINKG